MKKLFKILFILAIFFVIYVYVLNITMMPKSITLLQGEKLELATLWGLKLKQNSKSSTNVESYDQEKTLETSGGIGGETQVAGRIDLSLNLFNAIDLTNITVNVIPKTKVVPLGNAIGLKLYTEGVLIVGLSEINGVKPYENTGIKEGDRIVYINNKKISSTDDLVETVNSSQGKEVQVKYVKEENSEEKTVGMVPVKTNDNEFKLGLWVRDAAAGVATATFYEPDSGYFGSLGHGITDVDTGDLVTIANGELVNSNIVSIKKGEKGTPGEIRGSIEGQSKIGDVYKNTAFGVFGKITSTARLHVTEDEMEVLSRNNIKTGKAQIICELEKGNKKYYNIEIEKIYTNNNKDNKSMLIKVTDDELIEKTGGIIQGMSGSPIIQNGKFVGAVTHVLVNDPTTGYGVFADMMLKEIK